MTKKPPKENNPKDQDQNKPDLTRLARSPREEALKRMTSDSQNGSGTNRPMLERRIRPATPLPPSAPRPPASRIVRPTLLSDGAGILRAAPEEEDDLVGLGRIAHSNPRQAPSAPSSRFEPPSVPAPAVQGHPQTTESLVEILVTDLDPLNPNERGSRTESDPPSRTRSPNPPSSLDCNPPPRRANRRIFFASEVGSTPNMTASDNLFASREAEPSRTPRTKSVSRMGILKGDTQEH